MKIPGMWRLKRAAKEALRHWKVSRIEARVRAADPDPGSERHGLSAPLLVSLTSYPARFPTLAPTIKTLLSQSMPADSVWLWIAREDVNRLPEDVKALERVGLRIGVTDDLKSYKKYVPAARTFPGAFIVIADDDVPYSRDWLSSLVTAYRSGPAAVIAHRARRMRLNSDGRPAGYASWTFAEEGRESDVNFVPNGIGGVLYPPGAISAEALDVSRFQRLAPFGDDLWLFWTARRAGFGCRMVERIEEPLNWNGSQKVALYHQNASEGGRNDKYVSSLFQEFGPPVLGQRPEANNAGLEGGGFAQVPWTTE